MPQAITAVYENGVFIPLTKVVLPDHTPVTISIPNALLKKTKKNNIKALFDIAPGGTETDISVNHDKYLYSEPPL